MMAKKEAAVGKRIRISKAQQHMMLSVLAASLVLGVCLVLVIYFIKYWNFNVKVIDEKDVAISNYEQSIINVGICLDDNEDGKFNEKELKDCNPTALNTGELEGTLRYNVLIDMPQNKNLESVGRDRILDTCYNERTGAKIDFYKKYSEAETDEERNEYLSMIRKCSALRVIPDALPAQKNEAALMSSLNLIFNLSDWEPEGISPSGAYFTSPIDGLQTIPITLSVESNSATTLRVLHNMERSIRPFDLQTATIEWSGNDDLKLEAQGMSYYSEEITAVEKDITVYATKEARKKANENGSNK